MPPTCNVRPRCARSGSQPPTEGSREQRNHCSTSPAQPRLPALEQLKYMPYTHIDHHQRTCLAWQTARPLAADTAVCSSSRGEKSHHRHRRSMSATPESLCSTQLEQPEFDLRMRLMCSSRRHEVDTTQLLFACLWACERRRVSCVVCAAAAAKRRAEAGPGPGGRA